MKMEKSLFERKEDTLLLVAFASLKHNGESTDSNNLNAEKSRIERIAESFYTKSKEFVEYNAFIMDWTKLNMRDIVYTDKFIYDIPIKDDYFEVNLDNFLRWIMNPVAKHAFKFNKSISYTNKKKYSRKDKHKAWHLIQSCIQYIET